MNKMIHKSLFSFLGVFLTLSAIYPNLAKTSPSTPLASNPHRKFTQTINSPSQQTCQVTQIPVSTCTEGIPSGRSIFTVSKGDQVFFGGNGDYINPDNYYGSLLMGMARYGSANLIMCSNELTRMIVG